MNHSNKPTEPRRSNIYSKPGMANQWVPVGIWSQKESWNTLPDFGMAMLVKWTKGQSSRKLQNISTKSLPSRRCFENCNSNIVSIFSQILKSLYVNVKMRGNEVLKNTPFIKMSLLFHFSKTKIIYITSCKILSLSI